MYRPEVGKGIIPAEAAEHHRKVKDAILKNALEDAGIKMEDVDAVAYSCGAGLPPCLNVGAIFSLELSKKYGKPLVPVCHQVAHLEIGRMTAGPKDPVYLYLSGGNTQIVALIDRFYRIFGETQDIPVGNCLDVVAREMGLGMPGGPEIERLAKDGKYVELPYVVKGMDISYSGIATAAAKLLKNGVAKEDVAFSLQEVCFSMLTEVTERAIAHTDKNEVLLVGGVAANKRLQEMVKTMCDERGAKFLVVPFEYSGDNGVNIAWAGMLAHSSGWNAGFKDLIRPRWRIDEVEITWP